MERSEIIRILSQHTEWVNSRMLLPDISQPTKRAFDIAIAEACKLLAYDERVINEQQSEICMLKEFQQ